MSPSPFSPPIPSLRQLAEVLHEGSSGWPGSLVVTVAPAETEVAIGTWPVPVETPHPADPLVGFLAPEDWTAIGLISRGRAWSDDPEGTGTGSRVHVGSVVLTDAVATPVRITSLFGRDGSATSLLTRADEPLEVIEDAPEGWVADVMARVLGRPTPPPGWSLSTWVEATWLDRIADLVLAEPGRVRRWNALARLHPLAAPGSALPGVLLAVETRALDLESSWQRMRHLWCGALPSGPDLAPPGGRPIDLPDWFDDGSFARWITRHLVPGEDLLPAILDAMPHAVGSELLEALVGTPLPGAHRG